MLEESAAWMQAQGRTVVDHVISLSPQISPYVSYGAAAAVTMGLGYYLTQASTNGKITPLVDPKCQNEILPDGSRQTAYLKGKPPKAYLFDDARTLYQGVRRGVKISGNRDMLGRRVKQSDGSEPYIWISYMTVLERADSVSIAFRELGIAVGNTTNIGIYAKNRPEWIITELATYNYSNVIVPIYETLGFEASAFILNQTEMPIVVCDDNKKAIGLIKHKNDCPALKTLVIMEPVSDELQQLSKEYDVQVMTFEELEALGKNASKRPSHIPPNPDDLATICYTSGTTGTPKGVMLSHANVVAGGVTMEFFNHSAFVTEDVMISFLPLAHMLERVIEAVCFQIGARVGFYRGDIRGLAEDIKELRPTVVPVVPRVLNRLYDKVMLEVNKSRLKKALFDFGLAYKARQMSNFIIRNDTFVDNYILKKVRDGMGGRVKLMITGSAPLAENVLTFVRCAMGCVVVEGYGQTECVAPCTVSMEGDFNAGHVGMVIPSCRIKLVDVPELGYFTNDNGGEVCVHGHIVFKGYYKNPGQTKEVLDDEGWLHTGDIGNWTKEGTLKIVDRKKHIFKLSQGEYVAPEKIENIYSRSQFVGQAFVYGESLKTHLIAVVVPDVEVLTPYCKKEMNLDGDLTSLCANAEVKNLILNDMIDIGKQAGLFSFEQVKDIFLSDELFTIENDLLTPTLKSKRPRLKEHYAKQLAEMYSKQC